MNDSSKLANAHDDYGDAGDDVDDVDDVDDAGDAGDAGDADDDVTQARTCLQQPQQLQIIIMIMIM